MISCIHFNGPFCLVTCFAEGLLTLVRLLTELLEMFISIMCTSIMWTFSILFAVPFKGFLIHSSKSFLLLNLMVLLKGVRLLLFW